MVTFRLFLASALFVSCRPMTEAGTTPESGVVTPDATLEGASCASDGDCGGGLVCFLVNPGCEPSSRVGECRAPSWGHECAANRPMCSCDGRTLWGKPCLGIIRERWSRAERCPCHADADCKGGQQCFFTSAGCDAAGECDDPTFVKCPAPTATFCTCKKKTLTHTCAQTMREPWSKAAACGL